VKTLTSTFQVCVNIPEQKRHLLQDFSSQARLEDSHAYITM